MGGGGQAGSRLKHFAGTLVLKGNQLPTPLETMSWRSPRVMGWWLPKGIFSALQFFD
jgi:hypothetical protein